MHFPSSSLGLNVKGLRGFHATFFFFFLLREDRLKFILRLTPKKVIKHFFVP